MPGIMQFDGMCRAIVCPALRLVYKALLTHLYNCT